MVRMFIDQINMMVKKLEHTKFDSTPKQAGNRILAVICKDNDAKRVDKYYKDVNIRVL